MASNDDYDPDDAAWEDEVEEGYDEDWDDDDDAWDEDDDLLGEDDLDDYIDEEE